MFVMQFSTIVPQHADLFLVFATDAFATFHRKLIQKNEWNLWLVPPLFLRVAPATLIISLASSFPPYYSSRSSKKIKRRKTISAWIRKPLGPFQMKLLLKSTVSHMLRAYFDIQYRMFWSFGRAFFLGCATSVWPIFNPSEARSISLDTTESFCVRLSISLRKVVHPTPLEASTESSQILVFLKPDSGQSRKFVNLTKRFQEK